MKMVSHDVDKLAKDQFQKLYFKDLMGAAVLIDDIQNFDLFVEHLYILLKTEFYSVRVENAQRELTALLIERPPANTVNEANISLDSNLKREGLIKSSPYYRRFYKIIDSVNKTPCEEGKVNIYYNEGLFELILHKYMPLCPLWSTLMLTDKRPVSNSVVENYFAQLKNLKLEGEKNLKCSRFVRKLREDVLSINIECTVRIPKSRLTKKDPTDEKQSQEKWSRKIKKKNTHFDARFLRNQSKTYPDDTIIFPEDDDEFPQCAYCGYGIISERTDWVKCDQCQRWIHQQCDTEGKNADKTYSGIFICKLCMLQTTEEERSLSDSKDLSELCTRFLDSLKLTPIERQQLEKDTRAQRNCMKWNDERKIRLTSSYFGRVCKIKQMSLIKNIIKLMREQKPIHTPAVLHGIKYEKNAIAEYLKVTNEPYKQSGLIIHPEHPFLAASPDGLIGTEGIIEVKCPFSAKDADPFAYNFNFLNRENTTILHNHDYHYQIQGILEIANRQWCDLVIYTFKGIKVVRINRLPKFWEIMYNKLNSSYYFHILPELVLPDKKLSAIERKWRTTQKLNFFDNGLVANTQYYKELENKRGYVVTVNPNVYFSLSEILIDDFMTLNDDQWVSSFIIDHCLCIFNDMTEQKYQIISVAKSSLIFDNNELGQSFIDNISLKKNLIVMPVVRMNHFVLIRINLCEKEITLIDPMGNETATQNIFMPKLLKFLQLKNINTDQWKFATMEHVRQNDAFNCGVFIINFFFNLTKNRPLTNHFDTATYRRQLKWLLLKHSTQMQLRCLYCSSDVNANDPNNSFRCKTCFRLFHEKCLLSVKEIESGKRNQESKINGICDLCRLN